MATLPDPVVTSELLDTLRSQPHLPDDIWYLVIAVTLCVLNRPEEIQTVYKHAVGPGHGTVGLQNGAALPDQEQLRIARRLREALLKTSAIGGMPKVRTRRLFIFLPSFETPRDALEEESSTSRATNLIFPSRTLDHQRPSRTQQGRPRPPGG